ncbi:MAG: DUF4249 domain-containing protein [Alistipes sp.]|nr:DUF4249 domain-containing protein [Alistipes sp.]
MKKYILPVILLLSLLAGCEKEIYIDYRTVEPLYVIEGRISNEGTEVLVTLTKDMDDGSDPTPQSDATVTLISGDGEIYPLDYAVDGYYRAADLTGTVGQTYTLQVEAGGNMFTSTSEMHGQAQIGSLHFQWLKALGEKVLFLVFVLEDIPDQENYYHYKVYRNGENYRWYVMNDRGNDGKPISVNVFCMTEQMAKDDKEDDREHILYEGDEISIELQTIDKRTYDYLYSVGLSESAASNPIDNFTGGCLGYFAAFSTFRTGTVFSYADIRE